MSNMMKSVRSAITEHVVNTGHSVRRDDCFKILHKVRDPRLLKFIEAIAIQWNKPKLNVQCQMDLQLRLPWL